MDMLFSSRQGDLFSSGSAPEPACAQVALPSTSPTDFPQENQPVSDPKNEFPSVTSEKKGVKLIAFNSHAADLACLKTARRTQAQNGDKHPLMIAIHLMTSGQMTLDQLATVVNDTKRLICEIDALKARNYTIAMESGRLARRMQYALANLAENGPSSGRFAPFTRPARPCLHKLPLTAMPPLLQQQLNGWAAETPLCRGSEQNGRRALNPATRDKYIDAVLIVFSALNKGHTEWVSQQDHNVLDLGWLLDHERLNLWMPILEKRYTQKSGIASLLSGLRRIGTDVLGHHDPRVEALQAEISCHFKPSRIETWRLRKMRSLIAGENGVSLLLAPEAIMKYADSPRVIPAHRRDRAAAALALGLKFAFPGLSSGYLARFDFRRDLREVQNGGCELRFPSSRYPDDVRYDEWLPLNDRATALLRSYTALLEKYPSPSFLLFPSRKAPDQPREVRVAMRMVYQQCERLVGWRTRMSDIKDLAAAESAVGAPDKIKVIADSLAYQAVRALSRRLHDLDDAA